MEVTRTESRNLTTLRDALIDLDGYFPFTPPVSKHAWEERRVALRRQIQVAEGVWPMPERGPVKATVHGPISRDESFYAGTAAQTDVLTQGRSENQRVLVFAMGGRVSF